MNKFLIISIVLLGFIGCDNNTSHQVTQKTLNGDNAIANYEWFKQQEQDIKAKYNQESRAEKSIQNLIDMLGKDRSEWGRQDKDEVQRLMTVRDGIGYQVDQMIADYNARCGMVNRSLFKDNLPTNIFRGTNSKLEFKYGKSIYMGGN